MGVIPILSTISAHYRESLFKMISTANAVYRDFLKSEEGLGFSGTVSIIGDEYSQTVIKFYKINFFFEKKYNWSQV